MIYSQDFLHYFCSIILTLLIGIRLQHYLRRFFDIEYARMITITILLHPFAIDSFLAPNTLSGTLPFYLFIEALNFENERDNIISIVLSFFAAIFNFSYCLFPMFFFWKKRNELKNIQFTAYLYTALVSFYLYKHQLLAAHSSLNFFSHFSLNIFVPFNLSVINYSLYPFSPVTTALSAILILALLWGAHLKKYELKNIWPLIAFPVIGNSFHQWVEPYKFWHDVILTSSNFFCLTFALIFLIAMNLPRKIFFFYAVIMFYFSLTWGLSLFPYSSALQESILSLPETFVETAAAKRVLAWQFLYEKRTREGKEILQSLNRDNPKNELIQQDLELLNKMK